LGLLLQILPHLFAKIENAIGGSKVFDKKSPKFIQDGQAMAKLRKYIKIKSEKVNGIDHRQLSFAVYKNCKCGNLTVYTGKYLQKRHHF
jgi:hypothetical protein